MPTIPVDTYLFDSLLPDLVGHDRHPTGFLVYLWLYRQAAEQNFAAVSASLRTVAESTGLSKRAIQEAIRALEKRKLIHVHRADITALPEYTVLRPWIRTSS
jgi:DNA-binding MarR family transcriptional regulator